MVTLVRPTWVSWPLEMQPSAARCLSARPFVVNYFPAVAVTLTALGVPRQALPPLRSTPPSHHCSLQNRPS